MELLNRVPADIVMLDINMPELDGIDTLRLIKKQFSKIKVIMLTQFGERGLVKKCIEEGVEGYLQKDCKQDELIQAINTVYLGGAWFKFNHLLLNNDLLTYKTKHVLTVNEQKILKLIIEEKCNKEIAMQMNIEINTVKSYKERLKEKTGTTTIIGLVKWAIENNLV